MTLTFHTSFKTTVLRVAGMGAASLGLLSLASAGASAGAGADTAAENAFANAIGTPPSGYSGPVFELSHDYPSEDPGKCGPEDCPWLYIDVEFTTGEAVDWKQGAWNDYIMAIMKVVGRGQNPNFPNETGFQTKVDGETAWYHVPWMAYDKTVGREFAHGTTNERTAHLSDFIGEPQPNAVKMSALGSSCADRFPNGFESWAVGMYNKWGGYAVGQAFPKDGKPSLNKKFGKMVPDGMPFPTGTMVTKFLTTNATPDCVPYLKDSAVWRVNRHAIASDNKYQCARALQETRLTQVDVAVVDPRSPTRWVYGTFGYSADAPGKTVLERLVPLGLQWGSDPESFPAVAKDKSKPITESVLNTNVGIYEHWGCNNRLAGPVDNPQSSCVSCHATAFAAPDGAISKMGTNVPPSFGFPGICETVSEENTAYFSNYDFPEAYPIPSGKYDDAVPLDTSLQLAVAFTQYATFANNGEPNACSK